MTSSRARPARVRSAPRSRLARGVGLIVLAVLLVGSGRLLASTGHHAYDPGAVPRSSYHLVANKTYQLSAAHGGGSGGSGAVGADPQCTYESISAPGAATRAVRLQSRRDDPRDLHVFATFSIGETGNFAIRCTGIAQVFVDDAENSGTDYSTALVVLAAVLGAWGVGLAVSGAAGDFPAPGSAGPQIPDRGVQANPVE